MHHHFSLSHIKIFFSNYSEYIMLCIIILFYLFSALNSKKSAVVWYFFSYCTTRRECQYCGDCKRINDHQKDCVGTAFCVPFCDEACNIIASCNIYCIYIWWSSTLMRLRFSYQMHTLSDACIIQASNIIYKCPYIEVTFRMTYVVSEEKGIELGK